MIQVGLTLSDENGNSPPGGGTWQFNFKFDLRYDPCGISFDVAWIPMLKIRLICCQIQQGLIFHEVWIMELIRANLVNC